MKPTKQTECLLAYARSRGAEGFRQGVKAPGYDKEFLSFLEGLEAFGDKKYIKMFDAWGHGWSAEHTRTTDQELLQDFFWAGR